MPVLSMASGYNPLKQDIADRNRHCVGAGESESSSEKSCGTQNRDYDMPLRIGTLFVILVTSAIGVFLPMLLVKLPFPTINTIASTIIKQFGTGVILSTAFVHVGMTSYEYSDAC
jgi:zinc transporter 1/2/3